MLGWGECGGHGCRGEMGWLRAVEGLADRGVGDCDSAGVGAEKPRPWGERALGNRSLPVPGGGSISLWMSLAARSGYQQPRKHMDSDG